MDKSKNAGIMSITITVCAGCEQLLEQASKAIRGLQAEMSTASSITRNGSPTEKQRQDFKARLLASFNHAQSVWDEYCEHLIEHGIVTEADEQSVPASARI